MGTSTIFAFGLVALVIGLNEIHAKGNRGAGLFDQSPYKHLLRTRSIEDIHFCEPGTTKKIDCNTCFCPKDGAGWACTRMMCSEPIPSSIYHIPPPRVKRGFGQDFTCVPNEMFMMDCNSCFCLPDGRTAGCTLMACPPKESSATIKTTNP